VSTFHIYRVLEQPATRYEDPNLPWRWATIPRWLKFKPREVLRCWSCGARRYAENLVVQVYYDRMVAHCRRGWKGGCRGDMR
jgi:hypothetical protein